MMNLRLNQRYIDKNEPEAHGKLAISHGYVTVDSEVAICRILCPFKRTTNLKECILGGAAIDLQSGVTVHWHLTIYTHIHAHAQAAAPSHAHANNTWHYD